MEARMNDTRPVIDKVKELISLKSHTEVADMLGITRATLYTRLELNNWKKGEMAIIRSL